MRTGKMWIAALCLGVMIFGGLAAGKEPQPERELKARLLAEGWTPIAPGVYERQRGPHKLEHLGMGREGLAWTLGELERQRDRLTQEYQSYPSEDLATVIDRLSVTIARAQKELEDMKSLSGKSATAITGPGCNICYSATADAYPLSNNSQGVGAIADAKLNSDCGYSGDTSAWVYARATLNGTMTTSSPPADQHTGASVTSHAATTVNGSSDCHSEATATVTSTALGISYSTSDTNDSCPLPPPMVTITDPSSTTISGTACQTLTWTSTVTGGLSPYTYAWTIDGSSAGTGTSASRTYCGNNTSSTQTVNVSLTVTDSAGQTGSKSDVTTITYTMDPNCCDPGPHCSLVGHSLICE